MADVPDDRPDRRASLHCESDGIVESFPMPQRMRRWVLADPQERLHDAAEFESEIARRTGIRPALPDGMRPTRFRARQHRAAGAAVGRVVLVGDALHETSPIGGQGMNLGWAGAQRLAVAIRSSVREAAAPDLHEYSRSALHAAAIAQRRSRFYMTMGRPARGAEIAARNALIRMLGVGPLRARTADMVTMRAMA
jgi:2-polyprenyl-6-methoxyphenol hydroxylase-like FAD-dependent oxidoreductase